MACACSGRKRQKFLWTSPDGETTTEYNSEIEAKAKVLRKGGTYAPVKPG